jgi:hypothetical protein
MTWSLSLIILVYNANIASDFVISGNPKQCYKEDGELFIDDCGLWLYVAEVRR